MPSEKPTSSHTPEPPTETSEDVGNSDPRITKIKTLEKELFAALAEAKRTRDFTHAIELKEEIEAMFAEIERAREEMKVINEDEAMLMIESLMEKYKNAKPFIKDDLLFLYEINQTVKSFDYSKDSRVIKLLEGRDPKKDIAYALDIQPEQVSLTKEEALSGNILYYRGSLYLNSLTLALGLTLPQSLGGDLYLGSLTSALGLTLPQSLGGSLNLGSLTSAEKEKLRKEYPHLKAKI